MGDTLQRLFSNFASGWPGFGLLLLRLSLGVASICSGGVIDAIAGVLLCAGLWTPVAGMAIALGEAYLAFSLYPSRPAEVCAHVFTTVISLSIAMLGPGAWSVDARLFGRKRFDLDKTRGRKISL